MKTICTLVGGGLGLAYGATAVIWVYLAAPVSLQMLIMVGVALVGSAGGWLAGLVVGEIARKK